MHPSLGMIWKCQEQVLETNGFLTSFHRWRQLMSSQIQYA